MRDALKRKLWSNSYIQFLTHLSPLTYTRPVWCYFVLGTLFTICESEVAKHLHCPGLFWSKAWLATAESVLNTSAGSILSISIYTVNTVIRTTIFFWVINRHGLQPNTSMYFWMGIGKNTYSNIHRSINLFACQIKKLIYLIALEVISFLLLLSCRSSFLCRGIRQSRLLCLAMLALSLISHHCHSSLRNDRTALTMCKRMYRLDQLTRLFPICQSDLHHGAIMAFPFCQETAKHQCVFVGSQSRNTWSSSATCIWSQMTPAFCQILSGTASLWHLQSSYLCQFSLTLQQLELCLRRKRPLNPSPLERSMRLTILRTTTDASRLLWFMSKCWY